MWKGFGEKIDIVTFLSYLSPNALFSIIHSVKANKICQHNLETPHDPYFHHQKWNVTKKVKNRIHQIPFSTSFLWTSPDRHSLLFLKHSHFFRIIQLFCPMIRIFFISSTVHCIVFLYATLPFPCMWHNNTDRFFLCMGWLSRESFYPLGACRLPLRQGYMGDLDHSDVIYAEFMHFLYFSQSGPFIHVVDFRRCLTYSYYIVLGVYF